MNQHKQQGAVLITTLFMTALASLLAASIAFKEHLFFQSSDGIEQWRKAYQNWQLLTARITTALAKNSKGAVISKLATTNTIVSVNGMKFNVSVQDAQGRYNINNITNPNQVSTVKSLLLNIKPSLDATSANDFSKETKNWIQPGKNTNSDSFYLRKTPPYYPSHGPLFHISELRLIKGFQSLDIPWIQWQTHFIALPSSIRVNRYDASPAVLSAVFQTDINTAQRFHDCVQSTPTPSVCDAEYLSQSQLNATVDSTQFILIQAIMNRENLPPLRFSSLLQITPSHNTLTFTPLWQRLLES